MIDKKRTASSSLEERKKTRGPGETEQQFLG